VRLLGIEIRRAFARRLTKIVIVIALAGIIAGGLTTYFKSQRATAFVGPSASQQERIKNDVIQSCLRGGPLPGQEGGPPGLAPAPGQSLPPIGTAERQTFCEKAAGQLQLGGFGTSDSTSQRSWTSSST
jgi:hypothetical protein